MKARVRSGRLVLDAPTELPEGTVVELAPVMEDDLDARSRRALEAALARSAAQVARGELHDAGEVLRSVDGRKR